MPAQTTRRMRRAVQLLRQQGRFGNLTHAQLDRFTADILEGIADLEVHLGIAETPPAAEIVQLRGMGNRILAREGDVA